MEEVDGSLRAEYDSKLCDALGKMREEMEQQRLQAADDTDSFYERKVSCKYKAFNLLRLSYFTKNLCNLN